MFDSAPSLAWFDAPWSSRTCFTFLKTSNQYLLGARRPRPCSKVEVYFTTYYKPLISNEKHCNEHFGTIIVPNKHFRARFLPRKHFGTIFVPNEHLEQSLSQMNIWEQSLCLMNIWNNNCSKSINSCFNGQNHPKKGIP